MGQQLQFLGRLIRNHMKTLEIKEFKDYLDKFPEDSKIVMFNKPRKPMTIYTLCEYQTGIEILDIKLPEEDVLKVGHTLVNGDLRLKIVEIENKKLYIEKL